MEIGYAKNKKKLTKNVSYSFSNAMPSQNGEPTGIIAQFYVLEKNY